MPLISIILPCHNAAALLPATLAGLKGQTETDWEVICVNAGSTDKTLSVLMGYAAQDKRIRVVHQAEADPALAQAAGVVVAHGAWVTFAKPGKVWGADHLACLRARLRQDDGLRVYQRIGGTATVGLFMQAAALSVDSLAATTDFARLTALRAAGEAVGQIGTPIFTTSYRDSATLSQPVAA